MKVLVAGGGTGGHLYPGIAVAEELTARGWEVRFAGTARGIEARVCPKEGWPLDLIDVGGLKGRGLFGLLRGLLRLPRAIAQAFALLRREKPDLVVGVGGYASGPVVLAAALSGRATAILEQNSVPGITNRLLGKVVALVFGAFDSARRYFPADRYRLAGNPVRRRVREGLAEAGEGAQAAANRRSLLVVGGSQGAHAVNELVYEAMLLLKVDGHAPALIHQAGAADAAALRERYAAAGITADVREFIDDMAAVYQTAALVVARAGASTLAELTTLGLPSLLIPFPQAADDHQTVNARELEQAGAARLLVQRETTPSLLASAIRELLDDEPTRIRLAEAARGLGRPKAHIEIADALQGLVSGRALPHPT